jgi:hypothetical protein
MNSFREVAVVGVSIGRRKLNAGATAPNGNAATLSGQGWAGQEAETVVRYQWSVVVGQAFALITRGWEGCAVGEKRGSVWRLFDLGPDEGTGAFFEEEAADDEGQSGDGDGKEEPCIDIARSGAEADADHGKESAKDAVAEVIGQGDRGVADPGGECFDKVSGDGAIDHAGEDVLETDQHDQQRQVGMAGLRSGDEGVAGGFARERSETGFGGDGIFGGGYGDDVVAGGLLHCPVDGIYANQAKEHPGKHHFLSADAVGERSEEHEGRRSDH